MKGIFNAIKTGIGIGTALAIPTLVGYAIAMVSHDDGYEKGFVNGKSVTLNEIAAITLEKEVAKETED